jgi:hypothetical protein
MLKKIGDGDPKNEHAAVKARVERLREERIADGVEEANKFIQVVKDQAERLEKEVNVVKERVEMMRNIEKLIGEIIEGAGRGGLTADIEGIVIGSAPQGEPLGNLCHSEYIWGLLLVRVFCTSWSLESKGIYGINYESS